MRIFDLEERLIAFSVIIVEMTKQMSNSYAASHLSKQLLRSGTSVSLNTVKPKVWNQERILFTK